MKSRPSGGAWIETGAGVAASDLIGGDRAPPGARGLKRSLSRPSGGAWIETKVTAFVTQYTIKLLCHRAPPGARGLKRSMGVSIPDTEDEFMIAPLRGRVD